MKKDYLKQWTVRGYYPNSPLFGYTTEGGISQSAATGIWPIEVPGDLYETAQKLGVIKDPYFELNAQECEWIANRWWVYQTEFFPRNAGRCYLVFEGVEGVFHVFVNGKRAGGGENSFVPVRLDLAEFLIPDQANRILVMVENQKEDLNQSGYTSRINAQRTRYNSKWDFCLRMVSLGLVKPVYLAYEEEGALDSVQVQTDLKGLVEITANCRIHEEGSFTLHARVGEEEASVTERLNPGDRALRLSLRIKDPKLWQCNGNGRAELYPVRIFLQAKGENIDDWSGNIGFRTVEFTANEQAPAGALPYTLKINGKRTYIKGFNLVPMDMSVARVKPDYCRKLLTLAQQAGCNFVRVWGGGVIESQTFYDCCDQLGILVWQDFPQSSSGIDNCPTYAEEGIARLVQTAEQATKSLRHHPSLAAWCGGNELMYADWSTVGTEHPNVAALKAVVKREDPGRAFFPTTGFGPNQSGKRQDVGLGRHHDIHGPWTYDGEDVFYDFYNHMDHLYHGEFGVDGFANPEHIPRFMSRENCAKSDIGTNVVWQSRAEWWNCLPRDRKIFREPQDLEEQASISQFIQAEGVRYAVEANRRRAFVNSGSVIWQLNEPCPNLCCTNLVDYYLTPKPAYDAVRRAYEPVHVSFRYDHWTSRPGENWMGEAFLTSEERGRFEILLWVLTDEGETLLNHSYSVEMEGDGKSTCLGEINFSVPKTKAIFLMFEVKGRARQQICLPVRGEDGLCDPVVAVAYCRERRAEIAKGTDRKE